MCLLLAQGCADRYIDILRRLAPAPNEAGIIGPKRFPMVGQTSVRTTAMPAQAQATPTATTAVHPPSTESVQQRQQPQKSHLEQQQQRQQPASVWRKCVQCKRWCSVNDSKGETHRCQAAASREFFPIFVIVLLVVARLVLQFAVNRSSQHQLVFSLLPDKLADKLAEEFHCSRPPCPQKRSGASGDTADAVKVRVCACV